MAQKLSLINKNRQMIRIGKSKIAGKGLFANGPIKKGDTLFCVEGPVITYDLEHDYRIGANWLQIRKNIWQIPNRGNLWNFINHSCEPNCGMKRENLVVAMRDIQSGEELTIDYSIIEGSEHWRMHCKCGSINCRKLVKSIRYLPRELFLKYKHFIPAHLQAIYEQEKTYSTGVGKMKKLFAKNPIKKDEEIFSIKGPVIAYTTSPDMRIGYRWLAVGKNRWMIPSVDSPWSYIRHSCSPNVGMHGNNKVVAMRSVKPGEELTIDDSMTEADIRWHNRCHCGSKDCRGVIKSVQFLSCQQFKKYEQYMSVFIKKEYEKYNAKS